jgi:hypothetical protein
MGGGTSLVEAMRLHRQSIGTDLNSLATFVSMVKTRLFTEEDISALRDWVEQAQSSLILTRRPKRLGIWISQGYQRNISGRTTWPIRKTIELALNNLTSLHTKNQRDFIRCLLLKTAQWAIDCRKSHPSASDFRRHLVSHCEEMIAGMLALRSDIGHTVVADYGSSPFLPLCLHIPAKEIATPGKYPLSSPPKLILTSPPYPGVHVLYHRWQVNGRKETPAPYWIADCLDGNGASHYTFGDRKQKDLEAYYKNMKESYSALAAIANKNTWLVQLVAFSAPEWQLPRFLGILQECGFNEVKLGKTSCLTDGRAWRTVPNRKFYTDKKGETPSSREVLLIHKRSAL